MWYEYVFLGLQGMIEDPNFLHQWNLISSIDTNSLTAASFEEALQKHLIFSSFNTKTCMETSPPPAGIERPTKQLKSNSWNHNNETTQYEYSYSNNFSFADWNHTSQLGGTLKPKVEMVCPNMLISSQGNRNHVSKAFQEAKNIETRSKQSLAHDHIVAERKRREKLSQRFIALSALVPNLKKVSNDVN